MKWSSCIPNHNYVSPQIMWTLKEKDMTKTRNGTINGIMHGMGKFHGKAILSI